MSCVAVASMPRVVRDLAELPAGAHCLGLYASGEEAARQAVRFLAGAPADANASYWVESVDRANYLNERLAPVAPNRVGCVRPLTGGQVEPRDGRLRPVPEIGRFIHGPLGGVTAGADTLSGYLAAGQGGALREYEAWFDVQPRSGSRFLCPYDLRIALPSDPDLIRALGSHHSHVALSGSPEPAVRLFQLCLFDRPAALPSAVRPVYEWARDHRLVTPAGPDEPITLTAAGESVVHEWVERVPRLTRAPSRDGARSPARRPRGAIAAEAREPRPIEGPERPPWARPAPSDDPFRPLRRSPASFYLHGISRTEVNLVAYYLARSLDPRFHWIEVTRANRSPTPRYGEWPDAGRRHFVFRATEFTPEQPVSDRKLEDVVGPAESADTVAHIRDFVRLPDVVQDVLTRPSPADAPRVVLLSNTDLTESSYGPEPGAFRPFLRAVGAEGATIICSRTGIDRPNRFDFDFVIRIDIESGSEIATANLLVEKGRPGTPFETGRQRTLRDDPAFGQLARALDGPDDPK